MESARRVVKNTMFLYVRIIVNIVVSVYSTRLILGALGIDDFGIYNLVAGAVAMLTFLNSAMAEASQRFMAYAQGEGNEAKQNRIFNVSIVLHVAIGVLIVILLEGAGVVLFKKVLEIPADRIEVAKLVYQFMIISTFFTIAKVPADAVLNAHENMFLVAMLGIIQSIFKLAIAIYVTHTKFDQLIVYGSLIAGLEIFLILLSYIYCSIKYQEVRINLANGIDKKLFIEMGSFASWTLLNHSAFIITMQGTSIVLNSFFGVALNAAQGVANQVANQMKNFSMTMFRALNPVIIKKEGESNRFKMLEASMFGNKISFLMLSFLSIPLIIEMPYVLNLWLKEVPEFTVIFCRLILARLIIGTLTHTFYTAIGAIGDIKKSTIWESALFFLILPISIVMYKFGGAPEVIYIVFVVMGIGISGVRVYFLHRLGGLSLRAFFFNIVFRCVGVFALVITLSFLPYWLFDVSFLRLIAVLLISSSSFLILGYHLGLNQPERNLVKGVGGSYFNKLMKR